MALMGNVVVWKPSDKHFTLHTLLWKFFKEAGVPDGVINMIFTDGKETAERVLAHPDFAGLHFTGSTKVFQGMWKMIGDNIHNYKSYPRIVGETGGKDFVMAHPSADMLMLWLQHWYVVLTNTRDKMFCSTRAYVPKSIWKDVKKVMEKQIKTIKVGTTEDPSNFVNAVIDRNSFDKCKGYIDRAEKAKDAEVVIGGKCDDKKGYFVQDCYRNYKPSYESIEQEIFGPILTVYVYEDKNGLKHLN